MHTQGIFFYFGCVTQNKALDMMRLPLKCIYFYQRIYGVKIIDNRPYATTVSTIVARIFFLYKNWCKSFCCGHL